MKLRIAVPLVVVALGIAAFCVFRSPSHKLVFRAYFSNAMNIHSGAPVRLAG
jgi:ABC-type transporter Mla subunit MlaD